MGDRRRRVVLAAIKAVHTVAFFVIAISGLLVLFDGLRGRPRRRTAAVLAVSLGECAVFAANGFVCPMTPLAERYGAKRGSVSDIFLPDVISENLTWSGSAILALGIVLNARAFWQRRGATYTPGVQPAAKEDARCSTASSP
jgi:hypothetical protein